MSTINASPALDMIAEKRARWLANIGEETHADGTYTTPRREAQQRSAVDRAEVEANSGGLTWLAMAKVHIADIARQANEDSLVELLADLGATTANWIDDIKRRQAARRAP